MEKEKKKGGMEGGREVGGRDKQSRERRGRRKERE